MPIAAKRTTVILPVELHKRLKQLAVTHDITFTELLERAMRHYFLTGPGMLRIGPKPKARFKQ